MLEEPVEEASLSEDCIQKRAKACQIVEHVAQGFIKYVFGSMGGLLRSKSFSRHKLDSISKLIVHSDLCVFVCAMATFKPSIIR